MKKTFLLGILLLSLLACDNRQPHAIIETDMGTIKVMLYDHTPIHRDNFIKLAKEGFYDDLLFHRVISSFMIQGGDPNSRNASPGQQLGAGDPGYTLEAEIGSPHFRGTIAAARQSQNNPNKRSSGSQFYIVQGRPITDADLNLVERSKTIEYNDAQRQLYNELGGRPDLDNDYTVFGEVVDGIEVVDKIAAVPTDGRNRPLTDIRMKVTIKYE